MRKVLLLLAIILPLVLLGAILVLASHRTDHPAHLQDTITTPNFNYTIYYTDTAPADNDYFTAGQAQLVANAIDTNNAASPAHPGHHQMFLNLGFNAPFFDLTPPEVYIYDSSNLGGAWFGGIDVDAPSYLTAPELDVRLVAGHELFHHVQYGYIDDGVIQGCGSTWGTWTCEGTARMMQDKVYADLDADLGTTQAAYLSELSTYLTSTGWLNTSLTGLSYRAALFWNYLTEQLGAVTTEPQRGVDVIEDYWDEASDNTASPDPVGALRTVLNDLQPGLTLDEVWNDFVITSYSKDLDVAGLSDPDKYRYVDDNATAYASVATMIDSAFPPTIGPTAGSVNSYAARYYVGRPNATCDIIGFQSTGDQAAYGLLAITGTDTVERLYKSMTTDFAKALINRSADPYTRLVAVVGGLGSSANYTYTFACGGADLEIVRPNTTWKAYVGPHDDPERFLIIVNVTGPAELGTPSVQGLDVSDFTAYVGTADPANQAPILSGAYVQGSYWLVTQAPTKTVDAVYPLRVELGDLASATQEGVVEYSDRVLDQVLVIDASGSMNSPAGNTKLAAAQNAGRLFVDAASDDDQLGVVQFSGDNSEPNNDATTEHTLQAVLGQRTTAKNAIDAITPQWLTSIGDGLVQGQSEISTHGVVTGSNVIVLLSDGMENEAAMWSTISSTITSTVYAIALGPTTDQALMQEIATAKGGDYLYVDLSGASFAATTDGSSLATSTVPLPNRLADAYRMIHEAIRRHQRLWEANGTVNASETVSHTIPIKESGLTEPVFSVNWDDDSAVVKVKLLRPDGTEVKVGDGDVVDILEDSTHKVYHLNGISQLGDWQVEIELVRGATSINYLASLSAKNVQGVQLDVYFGQYHDDAAAHAMNRQFLRGLPMPIIATLTDIHGPIIGAQVEAEVEHPEGGKDRLELFDDGSHGDGNADDGIYANRYTRTTVGSTTGVDDRDDQTGTRGSYLVHAWASGQSNDGEPFERHKGSAFQLYEFDEQTDPDLDQDGLPDRWEKLFPCVDPGTHDAAADPDNDGLINQEEFKHGTNPCDPDTDDGGESDGSEVNRGANPLDPQDDLVPFPVDVEVYVATSNDDTRLELRSGANLIRFPSSPQYTTVYLYRSTSPDTGFTLVATLDPSAERGTYFDEGLTNGTTYYYKIQGEGAEGALTPFSHVFSGTPLGEPFAPRGSVLISGGATYVGTTNVLLRLNARKQLLPASGLLALAQEGPPQYTSEDLEMMVSNSPDFPQGEWEPLQSEKTWDLEPDQETGVARVYVKYRDKQGLESTIETDGVIVKTPGSLGSIQGKGLLEGQSDHTGILVSSPDNALVHVTFTDAAGDFVLANLLPGTYNLLLTHSGHQPADVAAIIVKAGEATDIGTVTLYPREMFWKAGEWTDYAPSGMPDFDQKQDGWHDGQGNWTYCGPVAAANSLWWFDSKFEPNPKPPSSEISDGYPLVQAYGAWDDHDKQNVEPFVNDLASWFGTDPVNGTNVFSMTVGIENYLANRGLTGVYTVTLMPKPDFRWVADEVERSEDVILLLGFWEDNPQTDEWQRLGGHYVTVAGIDRFGRRIGFSDPFYDRAESGWPGRVLPTTGHTTHTDPTVHNDAAYVSHDIYGVIPTFSPGGEWGPEGYGEDFEAVANYFGQNFPPEWEERRSAGYMGGPIATEVEYAIAVSPVPLSDLPENPSFSVKDGGPLGYSGADILKLSSVPGGPPVIGIPAQHLGLNPEGDDLDALSYGQDGSGSGDGGEFPCLSFEDLTPATEYHVGDVFATAGISLTAGIFYWDTGIPYSGGYVMVDTFGFAGGSGQDIWLNNINLAFDFGVAISGLELRFGEYGGNINIEINGTMVNFENFVDINGSVIAGVSVSATGGSGDGTGMLTLSGVINSFAIGGQELWIDDVCPPSTLEFEVLNFSVTPGASGRPGTEVEVEAGCSPDEVGGDEYVVPIPGTNEQVFDENGTPCSTNTGYPIGLTLDDDLDALNRQPPEFVDEDGNAIPDSPVYFSLAPGSASLGTLGVTPAHILVSQGGGPPTVFATPAQLGLEDGDDVDALLLFENGDGQFDPETATYPGGDRLVFSLAAGSPTLTALGRSSAALLVPNKTTPGGQPAVAFPAALSGLDFEDDLNAVKGNAYFLWRLAPFPEEPPEPEPSGCEVNPIGGPEGWNVRASLPIGREGGFAVIIGDRIYVGQGLSAFGDDTFHFMYHIPTDTWHWLAVAPVGRAEVTGVCAEVEVGGAVQGQVFVFGGRNGSTVLNDLYVYDPLTDSWAARTPMPTARAGIGAAWVPPRTAQDSSLIYVVGGRDGSIPHTGTALDVLEAYDVISDTWSTMAPMPVPMMDVYSTVYYSDTHKIYVIGGYDGSNVSNAVQIYDVAADSWSVGATMPTARSNLLAGICRGQIHAIGGFAGPAGPSPGPEYDVNEAYDPATNTWTTGYSPLPEPRSEFMTQGIFTGQDIYAIGDGIHGHGGAPHDVYTCWPDCYDFDQSGVVDVGDIQMVANTWHTGNLTYDLNGDGIITVVDIMLVVAHWGETCP